jgi:hypothetical protein
VEPVDRPAQNVSEEIDSDGAFSQASGFETILTIPERTQAAREYLADLRRRAIQDERLVQSRSHQRTAVDGREEAKQVHLGIPDVPDHLHNLSQTSTTTADNSDALDVSFSSASNESEEEVDEIEDIFL